MRKGYSYYILHHHLSNTNFIMTEDLYKAIEESPSLINIDLRETKVKDSKFIYIYNY